MSEQNSEAHSFHPNAKQRFSIMVGGAVLISMFLVYVALNLYQNSGALQLDLSRPGYDSARQEAIKGGEVFKGFSSDGPINTASLKEFEGLYKQKAVEALSIDAFSGDALSDKTLTIE